MHLIAGGTFVSCFPTSIVSTLQSSERWHVLESTPMNTYPVSISTSGSTLAALRKQNVVTNPRAAIYWSTSTEAIQNERLLLNKVTVHLSVAERKSGIFSDTSYSRAKDILRCHGVCILPGNFAQPCRPRHPHRMILSSTLVCNRRGYY